MLQLPPGVIPPAGVDLSRAYVKQTRQRVLNTGKTTVYKAAGDTVEILLYLIVVYNAGAPVTPPRLLSLTFTDQDGNTVERALAASVQSGSTQLRYMLSTGLKATRGFGAFLPTFALPYVTLLGGWGWTLDAINFSAADLLVNPLWTSLFLPRYGT